MNFLLVDDDAICNLISQKTLERMGIAKEVHTATNGAEAINLFNNYFQGSQTVPDIILLDLNMPVMDGFGFLEAFKRLTVPNKDNVKIVVVTSSASERDINRVRELGVVHYLNKPISEDKLMTVLN